MTATTCGHCDCAGPAGASRVSARVPNRNNVPAVHTHVAEVDGCWVYDDHGCDYCDSPWASMVAVDLDLDLRNYSDRTSVYTAYDMVRYGEPTDGKKTSKAVKDMVATVDPSARAMKRAHVCVSCREAGAHHADRTVPVAGDTCWDPAVRDEMVAKATAWAEWDVAESKAWTCHGKYWSYDDSHGPCPY